MAYEIFVEYDKDSNLRLDLVQFSPDDDFGTELIIASERTWEWTEIIDLINQYQADVNSVVLKGSERK